MPGQTGLKGVDRTEVLLAERGAALTPLALSSGFHTPRLLHERLLSWKVGYVGRGGGLRGTPPPKNELNREAVI